MKTLSRLEAAAFLKCDKSVVSKLYATGELRGAKIGRRMVFFEDDLVAYLRAKIEHRAATLRAIQAILPVRRGRPRRVLDWAAIDRQCRAAGIRIPEPLSGKGRPRPLLPKLPEPKD